LELSPSRHTTIRVSYFTTSGLPSISSSWCQALWDTRLEFLFQLNICKHTTSSLTKGWVGGLQLLLAFASAVILGSEFSGTRDHILLSQIRLPQRGGPGSHIYIPQEQGGPVISAGTGFPFLPLLRLAGLWWRYLNPPAPPGGPVCYALTHKFEADRIKNTAPNSASTFCVHIRCRAGMNWSSRVLGYDRRSVGQSAPEQSTHLGPTTRFPPLSESHGHEDRPAAYNSCRPSPVQAISGPTLAGPAATLHRLRFETSLFVAFHDSQGHGGGTRPRLHMGLVISIIFKSYSPCMWRYYLCIPFRVWSQWA
jgi:hypothetical protein